ncbi:MAG: RIP metalloprotease RseP [Candidatus Omnitrophota bacterium]
MFSIIVFLVVLGILILVHEFGHFIVAKKVGVKVERFSLGFGPVLLRKKKDETEYTINAFPLGGYVKMAGDNAQDFKGESGEYLSKPPGKRAAIVFFGPLLNYVLGILFFWLIFMMGYPSFSNKVGGLVEGMGAEKAGIQAGDRIISVDGKKLNSWEELQASIQVKPKGDKAKLIILRGDKELPLDVNIETRDFNDPLGKKHSVGLLGIKPDENELVKVRYGIFNSFTLSIKKTWDLTTLTYSGLWQMITGKLSMKESVTGPLGIFFVTSKAAKIGLIAVLHLMAVLSISLAIFNLLPLPVLDGGHILLLVIEKIRGKSLSVKADNFIMQFGMSLIILLALFVTYNDIVRLFGSKISKMIGN